MISPETPGPVEDEKKTPPSGKQDGDNGKCDCDQDHLPEEDGVDSANDFMKKFLKKSEG